MAQSFAYPYEEFADHVKAMKTVRQWEHTRFGDLEAMQPSRANNARVVEYFVDSYNDQKEAVVKAGLFLSIHDYIGRHAAVFSRTDFLEKLEETMLEVDPALLRAVHHAITAGIRAESLPPRKVLSLARAFKEMQPA